MKEGLTIESLCREARRFAKEESTRDEPRLYVMTDGKTIGTYVEQRFRDHLLENYEFRVGSSASGIDFPELEVDMKVTSIRRPQSSCPYKSARQKIYGLGYDLLVFVYEKEDDEKHQTSRLDMKHVIFMEKQRTADYQTTRGILEVLERDGNKDDVLAFISDRNLPVEEIGATHLAEEIMENPPVQGYLTISNALQWRLQYSRVVGQTDPIEGIRRIR